MLNQFILLASILKNFKLQQTGMELTWQSPAPTRAKMQSRIEMLAFSQGTKEPTCAIRIITPTCQCKQNPANC